MAQIISSQQFDMLSFVFNRGVTFDHHATKTQAVTLTSADIAGLSGSFKFGSSVSLWNGTAAIATADDAVIYAGNGLSANAAGTPNAGTVTGILRQDGDLGSHLIGVSINAENIFDASQTVSREDDTALLRAALTGDDRAILSAFDDVIAMQSGDDLVRAGGGKDDVSGNSGADTLFGEAGNDLLSGGFGSDILSGGYGRDVLHGDGGGDRLRGNQGADTIYGDAGRDRLFGGYGYDKLFGGTGADRLHGGTGKDVIYAGADADKDTFVFTAISDSPTEAKRDVLHDFTRGTDVIDLSGIDANSDLEGNQAFTFSGVDANDHAVWYSNSGKSIIVSADVDGDSLADFSIRVTLNNGVSASDFDL